MVDQEVQAVINRAFGDTIEGDRSECSTSLHRIANLAQLSTNPLDRVAQQRRVSMNQRNDQLSYAYAADALRIRVTDPHPKETLRRRLYEAQHAFAREFQLEPPEEPIPTPANDAHADLLRRVERLEKQVAELQAAKNSTAENTE